MLCLKKTTTIQSRQSSPPLPHRLQCSGSQDSFATDPFCGNGAVHLTNHTGNQWQITNCADTICPHMSGPGVSAIPPTIHNSATGTVMPLVPPALCNPYGSNSFNSFPTRWGPRTSCPIHSPYRGRIPNGSICSGHQVKYDWNSANFVSHLCFEEAIIQFDWITLNRISKNYNYTYIFVHILFFDWYV